MGADATINLSQLLMFGITSLVGWVVYNAKQERERMSARVDTLERQFTASLEKSLEAVWKRFETIESTKIAPLAGSFADVSKLVTAIGADIRVQISELKTEISRNHPTRADLQKIETDIARIGSQLVPRQANRRQDA